MALSVAGSASAKRFHTAATILAAASIILSCVYISFDEYGLTVQLDPGAYYYMSYLPGLIGFILSVVPGGLVLVGLLGNTNNKQKLLFATLAPAIQLFSLVLMMILSADGIEDVIGWLPDFIGFPLTLLVIVSLIVSIYFLCSEKVSCTVPLVAGVVLACLAFVLMIAKVYPFGESFYETYYVGFTFYNIAIWLSVAFTFYGTCDVAQEDFRKHAKQACDPIQPDRAPIVSIQNRAEEIKGLKELLDMGAITQEEYDRKKKELLGL